MHELTPLSAAIAVANKLAPIVWAVSTREVEFRSVRLAA